MTPEHADMNCRAGVVGQKKQRRNEHVDYTTRNVTYTGAD